MWGKKMGDFLVNAANVFDIVARVGLLCVGLYVWYLWHIKKSVPYGLLMFILSMAMIRP